MEQKIFEYVCELGRDITRIMLESYDDELEKSRDTKQYRDKGKRKTTIKTVYGEVEYRRRVYQTTLEDGRKAHVYLLDKEMQMDKIGLISTNLAEKDYNDGNRVAIPGHSRHHKQHVRSEHQCGWCMECHVAVRGENQRGRGTRSKTDGGGANRR